MNSFRFRFRSPPTPAEEAQEPRRWCADFETSRRTSRCQVSVERRVGPRGDDGDAGTPPSDRARRVSSDPHEHARVGTTRPGTETRAEVRAVGGCKHRHRGGALPETGARANAALPPLDAGSRPRACDAPCECARRRERGALWTTDDDAGRFCSLSRFEIKISRALDGDYTYYYAACLEKFLDCFGLLGRQYFETNWQCK